MIKYDFFKKELKKRIEIKFPWEMFTNNGRFEVEILKPCLNLEKLVKQKFQGKCWWLIQTQLVSS